MSGWRDFQGLWQDVRFGVRALRKSPGFTAVALLTFALGIGANTAVFSVVSGVLLRPLPYENPQRLARIWPASTISSAELIYLQQHARSFSSVAAFSPGWGIALTGSGEPRQLDAARVSANFFQTLGVRPVVGRAFAGDENQREHWDVIVLSHALWVSQFGGDSAVIGRIIDLGVPTRVVGVMPASFEAFQNGVDAWLPLQIDPTSRFYTGSLALGFARLAPGATLGGATAEVATLAPQMRRAFNYNDDYGRGGTVVGLHESLVGNDRLSLLVLMGAVAFVLLIAGANVGNLSLVQAVGKRRELAVRRALGATRGQIARQMLVQSLLIAVIGGAIGTAVGFAGVSGLKAILPHSLPFLDGVSLDARVLIVSSAVTLGIGLVFGIAPALVATRVDPDGALRVSAAGSGNRAGAATRRALVVIEVALAMVLVVGAGLMTESLWKLSHVNLGFDPNGVVSFRLQPTNGQVTTPEETAAYFDKVFAALSSLPGVTRVGASQHLPLSGFNWNADLEIERQPLPSTSTHPSIVWRSVAGDYFGAMRIPLLRGRLFTAADNRGAPGVVVVSDAMAKQFWHGRDPIGERIRIGNGSNGDWATIVGIVGGVRSLSADLPERNELYRPNTQQNQRSMHIVVRTNGEPLSLVPQIRTAVRALDTTVPIAEIRSLQEVFGASTATPRMIAMLLLAFAGVGLMLGAIGIYGVISYGVSQRTRELGIRVALGAAETNIVAMVLGEGVQLAGIGIVIGSAAALVAARSLRTLVFGVTTTDATTYLGVAAILTVAALVAAYVPARRAARVDPLSALRSD